MPSANSGISATALSAFTPSEEPPSACTSMPLLMKLAMAWTPVASGQSGA